MNQTIPKTRLAEALGLFEDGRNEAYDRIYATQEDAAHLANITSVEKAAFMLIDVQTYFADPDFFGTEGTDQVSKRIAALAPAFRQTGAPLYAVLCPVEEEPEGNGYHHFRPEAGDIEVTKSRSDAFQGSDINQMLKSGETKTLIMAGFNLSACVMRTAQSARKKGYEVFIMGDIADDNVDDDYSGETETTVRKMRDFGIRFVSSQDVLRHMSRLS